MFPIMSHNLNGGLILLFRIKYLYLKLDKFKELNYIRMLTEGTLTILIVVIFVTVLLLQIKLLNTVAKRQYNIQEQMKESEDTDFHKEGPEVKNPN